MALITISFERVENGLVILRNLKRLPRTKLKEEITHIKELTKGAGWEVCSTRLARGMGNFGPTRKRFVV